MIVSLLKELNLSYFNTSYANSMSGIFSGCTSLEKLNISNFNTTSVTDMSFMFCNCSSLKDLNISHFNIKSADTCRIFLGCSEELKKKVKEQNKNIKINY